MDLEVHAPRPVARQLERLVHHLDGRPVAGLVVETLDVLGEEAQTAVGRILPDAGRGVGAMETVARGGELDPVLADRVLWPGTDRGLHLLALRQYLLQHR